MRLLIRPRSNTDFTYATVRLHAFAEFEIGGVRLHQVFRWKGPVFALEGEDVIGPGGFHNPNRLLKNFAIDSVLFVTALGKVGRGRAHAWNSRIILKPASLITTSETDRQAAPQNMVKRRDLLSY